MTRRNQMVLVAKKCLRWVGASPHEMSPTASRWRARPSLMTRLGPSAAANHLTHHRFAEPIRATTFGCCNGARSLPLTSFRGTVLDVHGRLPPYLQACPSPFRAVQTQTRWPGSMRRVIQLSTSNRRSPSLRASRHYPHPTATGPGVEARKKPPQLALNSRAG